MPRHRQAVREAALSTAGGLTADQVCQGGREGRKQHTPQIATCTAAEAGDQCPSSFTNPLLVVEKRLFPRGLLSKKYFVMFRIQSASTGLTSCSFFFLNIYLCEYLGAQMCVCAPCVQGSMEVRRGAGSPRIRISDNYELPCGCWELSLGPL